MPTTKQQFITRAVREARGGLSEEEASIYEDVALLHFEDAMHALARSCQGDQMRRPLLLRAFSFEHAYTGSPGPFFLYELDDDCRLWVEGLRYATLYTGQKIIAGEAESEFRQFVPEDNSFPLQWEAERSYQLMRRDSPFGTFSYQQNVISVLPSASAVTDYLIVQGLYLPNFSDTYPMPLELEWQAVEILAKMLRTEAPVKA